MSTFKVPTRESVSPANQVLFDHLRLNIGMVPNLYATMANSENALATYLAFSSAKTSLTAKEKEVVNLVGSQLNNCDYCNSAHTAIAKLIGFADHQILEIRKGGASFDSKLNALAKLTVSIVKNKGAADQQLLEQFFTAGYGNEQLIDLLLVIADKVVTNYLYAITGVPIDFPVAPKI